MVLSLHFHHHMSVHSQDPYHLEKGGKRLHIVETAHLNRLADLQEYGAFQMAGKIGASTRHFDYHTHVHSQDSYHLVNGGTRLHVVEMAPCRLNRIADQKYGAHEPAGQSGVWRHFDRHLHVQ
jgi:hypothetical protein